jgi:hypothetical protein
MEQLVKKNALKHGFLSAATLGVRVFISAMAHLKHGTGAPGEIQLCKQEQASQGAAGQHTCDGQSSLINPSNL